MPLLLEACPGFQPTWQAHLDWCKDEEPGAYNNTSEFARYLVESFESGQISEFPAAFAAIEKILNEGDQGSRDIAGIGVIESLQTNRIKSFLRGRCFRSVAGPHVVPSFGRRLRVCGKVRIA